MKKKILTILCAICLIIPCAFALVGCDMSAADIAKWEQKADTAIEKLDKTNSTTEKSNELLEKYLSQLSKQEAYDILSNANANMKLLNINDTPYSYEMGVYSPNITNDPDLDYYKYVVMPTGKSFVMKGYDWDDENNQYANDHVIYKLDFNQRDMSYVYENVEGEELAQLMDLESFNRLKAYYTNYGEGEFALRDFEMDNILSYSCDKNGVYTFKVIISYVYDMDSLEGEDNVTYAKYVKHYTIKVKDGLFQSIDQIGFFTSERYSDFDFVLDANGQKVPDGFGGYEITVEPKYDSRYTYTFNYGSEVDSDELESINNFIAEYDQKAENGEIPTDVEWE